MVVLGGPGWSSALRIIPPSYIAQPSILKFFIYFYELHHLHVEVHLVPLLAVHLDLQDVIWCLDVVSGSQITLFAKFDCSTPKFRHFHEVPHLLIEVHLVPLLPVHLDLLFGGPWWNEVVLSHEKHSPKFCCSTLNF